MTMRRQPATLGPTRLWAGEEHRRLGVVDESAHYGYGVTSKDVALRAGVALSSVSRVLSGSRYVSEAMRKRVETAALELGYQPDLLARSLRSGSTQTIGFILRDISNPLFANVAKHCEQVLRRAKYSMVITSSDGDLEVEAANLELLRRRRVDAIIVSLVSETCQSTKDALHHFPGPVVLLDREVEGLQAGAIHCDHRAGVRQATQALLSRGHRSIGLITGSLDVRSSRERYAGYLDGHEALGIDPLKNNVVFGDFDARFAQSETIRMLSRPSPITALITGGFGTTTGALRGLRQLRKEPGHDVSIVALDEWPGFDVFSPWLSSVVRNSSDIGDAAAQLVLDMLAGSDPRTELIDTVFVPRETLGTYEASAERRSEE
jgi:LacI family transcriptional regulator